MKFNNKKTPRLKTGIQNRGRDLQKSAGVCRGTGRTIVLPNLMRVFIVFTPLPNLVRVVIACNGLAKLGEVVIVCLT